MDNTIIYYTANTEDEAFERKIRNNILAVSNDLPIISVSRKPIDFGYNICVGEWPVCYANEHRQLLVGLQAAKTRFCIAAEADVLYPPEYFAFTPPTVDHVYRYDNVYAWYLWRSKRFYGKYWHKSFTEGAQMCGREYWIERIKKTVNTNWNEIEDPPLIFGDGIRPQYSWTGNPVITIKTGKGVRRYTTKVYQYETTLPYWGDITELERKYT